MSSVPDARGAAEQAAAEPGALLVGPVDQRDRDGRRALGGERAEQLQPGHHAERAVEPAALRHAVEVAADDEHARRWRRGSTAHRLPASSVSTSTGSVRQRLAQQRPRLQPLGRPRQPAATPPARRCGRRARGGRRRRGPVVGRGRACRHAAKVPQRENRPRTLDSPARRGRCEKLAAWHRDPHPDRRRLAPRSHTPTRARSASTYTPEQDWPSRNAVIDLDRFRIARRRRRGRRRRRIVRVRRDRAGRGHRADGRRHVGVRRHDTPAAGHRCAS